MTTNPQAITTGMLLQEYREVLLALGAARDDTDLSKRADALEAEISRRMAW